LLGYEESGSEAFPVILPGVSKILSSNSLKQYDTPELEHYFMVYCNINRYGLPFKNWTETPVWVLRLIAAFDAAMKDCKEYEYKRNKGKGKWQAD
jgi:saccharopine dehydrogenase-like NADP-dependent oxidoreductase